MHLIDHPSYRQDGHSAFPLLLWSAYFAFFGVAFSSVPGGTIVQKATLLFLLLSIVIFQLHRATSKRSLNMLAPFLCYLVLASASAFSISSSVSYVIFSIQPLLFGPLLYLSVITCNFDEKSFNKLRSAFIFICFAQIAFAFVKFSTHGVDEKYLIGTMSHRAGQLGFLFPACAVPILFFMLNTRNRLIIYSLILGLFVFGVINEKRSVVFLLPIIILGSWMANRKSTECFRQRKSQLGRLIAIFLIVGSGSFLGLSTIPSLNPESKYGGAINPAFAFDYALEYLTMDYGGSLQGEREEALRDTGIQVGRIILTLDIIDWWINELSWSERFFGIGFGSVTPSEWLGGRDDSLFAVLGTRGAISGAGLTVIETGLFGLGLYVLLFVKVFSTARFYARRARLDTALRWYKTVLVLLAVFAFDFFFYSTVLMRTLPMPFIFFAVAASLTIVSRLENSGVIDVVRAETESRRGGSSGAINWV